ncbi:MAG: serine/threonine-protein kinase [Prochlorothrix sp.]
MTSKLPGRRILRSKYRVLGLVGQGQFGKVYCAAHRKTGRLFALKALDHRRFPTNQFLRELRFLLSLRHPNIAGCQALEHTATGRYLVMDYCEGGTLRTLMEGETPLNITQGLKLTREILLGLEHAHDRGVIHCDIKPENVLLRLGATGWICQITDFGIARMKQESRMGSGSTGSPAYMAPERFYGQYHANADLYAVGVMLYELLVGSRPFSGTPMELMTAHLNRSPTIPDTVPEPLQAVLDQSLQKLPARRFQTAHDMRLALEAAAQSLDLTVEETPVSWFTPPQDPPGPSPWQPAWQRSIPTPVYHLAITIDPLPATPDSPPTEPDHPPDSPAAIDLGETSPASPDPSPTIALLYKGGGRRLNCTVHTGGRLDSEYPPLFRHKLGEEVQDLVSTPLGCFVVLQSRLELWRLRQPPAQTGGSAPAASAQPHCWGTYQSAATTTRMAVSPDGRWFAVASPESSGGESPFRLEIGQVAVPVEPAASGPLADLSQRQIALQVPEISQVLIMDKAHGLAIGRHNGGSGLEFFNRRGQRFGQLDLRVEIDRCVLTPKPYRLLARESRCDRSLLLLDLKPYRMRRIPLAITPDFFVALSWGYCIASRQGEIVMLDQEYNQVGHFQLPALEEATPATVTALTRIEDTQLTIATWAGTQGYLYGLEVTQLDLDMIF